MFMKYCLAALHIVAISMNSVKSQTPKEGCGETKEFHSLRSLIQSSEIGLASNLEFCRLTNYSGSPGKMNAILIFFHNKL